MMADDIGESDRLRQEKDRQTKEEIEALGAPWALHSDQFLVGYVKKHRHTQFQTPAIVEVQRRLLSAIRDFNRESGKQASRMISLTWAIIGLTVVLTIIAGLQLWAMLKGHI